MEAICAARPVTMDGHRARAASLALFAPHLLASRSGGVDERFVTAIVRDLIGEPVTAKAGPVAEQPDAELLTAIAAFWEAETALYALTGTRDEEADMSDAMGGWYAVIEAVTAIPSTTAVGLQAKGRMAHRVFEHLMKEEIIDLEDHREERLALTVLSEMAGRPAADL